MLDGLRQGLVRHLQGAPSSRMKQAGSPLEMSSPAERGKANTVGSRSGAAAASLVSVELHCLPWRPRGHSTRGSAMATLRMPARGGDEIGSKVVPDTPLHSLRTNAPSPLRLPLVLP